jgi:hypothetical protein
VTSLSRTAVLPFEHLEAELIAFPLSSETALELALTRLDPKLRDRTGRGSCGGPPSRRWSPPLRA